MANLDQVPKVGDTITIPEENVLGIKSLGWGLVGQPIVVTARDVDIKIGDETVPHIYAQTESSPDPKN